MSIEKGIFISICLHIISLAQLSQFRDLKTKITYSSRNIGVHDKTYTPLCANMVLLLVKKRRNKTSNFDQLPFPVAKRSLYNLSLHSNTKVPEMGGWYIHNVMKLFLKGNIWYLFLDTLIGSPGVQAEKHPLSGQSGF